MTLLALSHKDRTRDPQSSDTVVPGEEDVGAGRGGQKSTESTEQRQVGGRVWGGLCVHVGWSLVASEGRLVSIRWHPHLGATALGEGVVPG